MFTSCQFALIAQILVVAAGLSSPLRDGVVKVALTPNITLNKVALTPNYQTDNFALTPNYQTDNFALTPNSALNRVALTPNCQTDNFALTPNSAFNKVALTQNIVLNKVALTPNDSVARVPMQNAVNSNETNATNPAFNRIRANIAPTPNVTPNKVAPTPDLALNNFALTPDYQTDNFALTPNITLNNFALTPNHQTDNVALTPADSDEIALGAALLTQFDNDRGVTASPQSKRIEAYLQRLADSLGRHTKRKLPWHIHYDSHPGIKSGFALPGGYIVLWGGAVAYMSTEDELAAIIAHEIAHTDEGQVTRRIDSLVTNKHRSVKSADGWNWREFGATYGETLEKVCDFEGVKIAVKAGYSPVGLKMLLESFIALGTVHAPNAPPSPAIVDRIDQIKREIASEHWEALTTTRPLRLPN